MNTTSQLNKHGPCWGHDKTNKTDQNNVQMTGTGRLFRLLLTTGVSAHYTPEGERSVPAGGREKGASCGPPTADQVTADPDGSSRVDHSTQHKF